MKGNMPTRKLRWLTPIFLTTMLGQSLGQQVKTISTIYGEGKVMGSEYTNPYFGLLLKPAGAQFTEGGFIIPNGERARLIDAEANSAKWEDRYSIAVLADALSANPRIHSPEQYLQLVRHNFEKEGLVSVQQETPTQISGIRFFNSIMKTQDARPHFQGMYATFLNGYILSIQIEAASPERVKQIVETMVVFKH